MKPSRVLTFSVLLASGTVLASQASAQTTTVTEWNFNNYAIPTGSPAPLNVQTSPTPTTGSGTAASLGMTNSYNVNVGGTGAQPASVDTSDITNSTPLSTDPSPQPNGTNNEWRIRGGNGTVSNGPTGTPAPATSNGWSSFAPIGTQGAQFLASTVGYTGVQVSFDWSPTKQGEANLQVMYTLNSSAATPTYLNVPAALFITLPSTVTANTNTTSANTVMGGYITTTNSTTFNNGIVINLSGIAGVSNNPNFGIELVNASTGADDVSTAGTALNNTSGNWRFDEVAISGTAVAGVPEPSTCASMFVGALGLVMVLRRLRGVRA